EAAWRGLREKWRVLPDIAEQRFERPVVKNAETAAQHGLLPINVRTPGKAKTRPEVIQILVVQVVYGLHRAVDKPLRAGNIVAQQVVLLGQWIEVSPAEPQIDRQIGEKFPIILDEQRICRVAEMALAVGLATGIGIHGKAFEEAARIVREIQ